MEARKAWLLASALLLPLTGLTLSSAAGTRARQARQEAGGGTTRQAALSAYGRLPLSFVGNAGQLDRRVHYSARAGSTAVYLTRREAVLTLSGGSRGLALRLRFLGASPSATIAGAERSPGRVNHLIGNDPARWQRNLPTYREVVYRGLWPGIDLRVRGEGGYLKYEFRLAPGADPARITLAYRGQERLSLDRSGALRIATALGILRDARPVSYQLVGGKRVAVASRFALGGGGAYGFALGAYDSRHPLVIDPGLVYSTYLGGGGYDDGVAIAVDGAGSAYVTGPTWSRDFPTAAGAFDRSHNGGGGDVFVTKLNATGSALVYSTYLGGSGRSDLGDGGNAIAVDEAGSAYVTGRTESRNFPTTTGAFDRSYGGSCSDAFATKLSPAGAGLAYSTYLGGSSCDIGAGIAVDGAGNAYVAGWTLSTNFPTTAGAFDTSYNGVGDDFVTKLTPSGSALAYSTYLVGDVYPPNEYSGYGIAVDEAGSAYVTGVTGPTHFPTTPGAYDTSYNGGAVDAFVTKLNPSGSALAYSTYVGGSAEESGYTVAVDVAGEAYVTGTSYSRAFPTTAGAFDRSYNGRGDAFVTKLSAAGSALVYSTFLGGRARDWGYGIAVHRTGSAFVTGFTLSRNFPTTAGAFDRSLDDAEVDAYVTKLNEAGSALAYSSYLGGGGNDYGRRIAVDEAGSAYVTGHARSTDFPTTAGAFDMSYNGSDAFVTKLDLIAGPPSCIVPQVVGLTLAKAKRTIRAARCSVGRVSRIRSRRVGRVLRQSPRPGAVRKRGFRVNLVVGRR